ncbi:MAG: CarD family transcriptional regulator, partial [Chloroflexota bacterium]
IFYERAPWGEPAVRSRIETLAALSLDTHVGQPPFIVTSARALMQRTLPGNQFRKSSIPLKVGDRFGLDKLIMRWIGMGYEPVSMVIEPGTFSRRGGILDVYPMALDHAVRIEFFDDEIDSLRAFDVSTQRSSERLQQVLTTPAREALPESTPPLAAALGAWFEALPATSDDITSPQADYQPLANGVVFPFIEHYLPYLYPNPVSLLDYAPDNALIVVEDGGELRDTVAEIEETAERTRAEKIAAGILAPDYPVPYIGWDALAEAMRSHGVVYLGHSVDDGELSSHDDDGLRGLIAPELRFGGQLKGLLTHLRKLRNDGDRVVTVTMQAARMSELWQEQESGFVVNSDTITEPPASGSVVFVEGALQEGWRLRAGGGELHVFSDAEIFGWSRPEPRRLKPTKRARSPEGAYADLNEGDYVVHVDYGVGRFAGMRRRTIENTQREYLVIEYAGTDALFVPIHQTDRLSRYVGPDDKPPTLSKLGQPDWIRIKGKARQAVEEEAHELLAIYAKRAAAPGYEFSLDTPWQHELEASFPYVETEDQIRAVRDVKYDMEQPHPMDRLICGDVGFGKTEVALRAAFKAVIDSKQVAFLVP